MGASAGAVVGLLLGVKRVMGIAETPASRGSSATAGGGCG